MPITQKDIQKKYGSQVKSPKKEKTPDVDSSKEAVLYAFNACGGGKWLAEWAKRNPDEFFKLFGRLIPVDKKMSADVSVTFVDDLK